ncbi:type IV toxin-antitoxin system AbiEi family antitoxin [Chitinophaga pinensis]|uniref:Uncharacterized protein n=1 Tax=Chitinophaga pinensis (strain ATCC 43595 / DSM 2588 / LMG 13176 / NBRC 15968 / NCIMB 11800 / UQM 2034) TaxID=485918 RepID=A0A979GM04_CHIPD|nr:type IV toxin-antitoxin system AbiEi family antitoxin [Chitinophaga pinensis]ACU57517.1 conserved hypothetical protein [Chitinophaga pinensis DSM 2588]
MRELNIEKDILNEGVKVLRDLIGVKIKTSYVAKKIPKQDAIITFDFGGEHHFNVEVKGEIRQSHALSIIERFGRNKNQWLLISRYIPQPLKEQFRKFGINYLELAGNCYIRSNGILIYVTEQKVTPTRVNVVGKLWKPSGLKFLLAIINTPTLLQASYRDIASAAGIALGNVGLLLGELQNSGYTKKVGNVEEIINYDQLVMRWTDMYHATLRPKLLLGRFRFLKPESMFGWEHFSLSETYWGGEPGAAILTGHLTPEQFIIYTRKSPNELIKMLGIIPDSNGNITVFDKFWGEPPHSSENVTFSEKKHVVPPLLVYADLINEVDSRDYEVAGRIKKHYLNGK